MDITKRRTLAAVGLWSLGLGLGGSALAQGQHLARKPFTPAGAIRTVDVLEVVQQQSLLVVPRSTVFQARGSSPAAFTNAGPAEAALVETSQKLHEAFRRKNSSLASELTRQLVAAMHANKLDAKVIRGHRIKNDAIGSRMELGEVNTSADAVLYTVLRFAGYKEEADGFVPTVGIDAYLFDARTGQLLYRQIFNQGAALVRGPEVESLPLPARARYSSRAALASGADAAADGLVEAMAPVAARISEQISR